MPGMCHMKLQRLHIHALDDDEFMLRVLAFQLGRVGFKVMACSNADKFLENLERASRIDAVILDYYLSGTRDSGLDICRKIKARHNCPVIMLTGNSETDSIVACLNAGADQYVVKPYKIEELAARIMAAARLYTTSAVPVPENGKPNRYDVSVDWNLRLISVNGAESAKLTEKELALLEIFLASIDGYIDRASAFSSIYGYEMEPMNRTIDILVSRLRKKLCVNQKRVEIVNIRGLGYSLKLAENTGLRH